MISEFQIFSQKFQIPKIPKNSRSRSPAPPKTVTMEASIKVVDKPDTDAEQTPTPERRKMEVKALPDLLQNDNKVRSYSFFTKVKQFRLAVVWKNAIALF